ncbi:MAG: hypothetical protein ACLR1V_09805 [Coprococcus sp.]
METKLVYFSSSALLDENMNQAVSGGNYELISNVMSWMIDKEESISIPAKSLSTTYLTVTAADAGFWGAVVILIPAALCDRRRCGMVQKEEEIKHEEQEKSAYHCYDLPGGGSCSLFTRCKNESEGSQFRV